MAKLISVEEARKNSKETIKIIQTLAEKYISEEVNDHIVKASKDGLTGYYIYPTSFFNRYYWEKENKKSANSVGYSDLIRDTNFISFMNKVVSILKKHGYTVEQFSDSLIVSWME